jgi:hypothetical protein
VSTFECPRCGAVSHHPDDARFEWCGRCEDFTTRGPLPAGWRWWPFVGGSHDGDVIPLPAASFGQGYRYEAIGTGEVWTMQGRVFRLLT